MRIYRIINLVVPVLVFAATWYFLSYWLDS
jgi:hypothetical protein